MNGSEEEKEKEKEKEALAAGQLLCRRCPGPGVPDFEQQLVCEDSREGKLCLLRKSFEQDLNLSLAFELALVEAQWEYPWRIFESFKIKLAEIISGINRSAFPSLEQAKDYAWEFLGMRNFVQRLEKKHHVLAAQLALECKKKAEAPSEDEIYAPYEAGLTSLVIHSCRDRRREGKAPVVRVVEKPQVSPWVTLLEKLALNENSDSDDSGDEAGKRKREKENESSIP